MAEGKAVVNGQTYSVDVKDGLEAGAKTTAAASGAGAEIKSPLPGVVLKLLVQEGSFVKKGTPVILMEAMKMESEIKATADGKISFKVKNGEQMQTGSVAAVLN